MLSRRIIPCLDIKDGQTVKGVNFVELRHAGDPVELAEAYVEQGADELVFLDITASVEKRKTFAELVNKIAFTINIPFTVGGGIRTIKDAEILLNAGADKVTINTSAVENPQFVDDLVNAFGSQFVVVAIDSKKHDKDIVYTYGGRKPTERETKSWAKEVQERGAGEILLTSMDHDGTKQGFALDITGYLAKTLSIPVIASGGAGNMQHFEDVFNIAQADAALAASIFHFGEIKIPDLKEYLAAKEIVMRIK